jgi:hydroxymethylpyrimidine/phosphomethylpyrimidine kinase
LGNDQLAAELISLGVKSVLVTGTHADSNDVENRLYDFSGFLGSWTWPRLDNEYHGSGCTLASAIAGYLVSGEDLKDAVFKGQQFTWNSLKDGYVIGSGQLIPDRGGGIK